MIGEIESGVEETRMAQREYDSFAIGVLNDGNAVAPLDLSINVWADVRHSSEIDFGILDWQLHPNTSHIHPYMYG